MPACMTTAKLIYIYIYVQVQVLYCECYATLICPLDSSTSLLQSRIFYPRDANHMCTGIDTNHESHPNRDPMRDRG